MGQRPIFMTQPCLEQHRCGHSRQSPDEAFSKRVMNCLPRSTGLGVESKCPDSRQDLWRAVAPNYYNPWPSPPTKLAKGRFNFICSFGLQGKDPCIPRETVNNYKAVAFTSKTRFIPQDDMVTSNFFQVFTGFFNIPSISDCFSLIFPTSVGCFIEFCLDANFTSPIFRQVSHQVVDWVEWNAFISPCFFGVFGFQWHIRFGVI